MSVTELLISDATVTSLPIDQVVPAADNPRVDLGDLEDLATSIRSMGILQRIVVTRRDGGMVIVAGHRRHAAARLAGLTEVPVEIIDIDEPGRQQAMLIENLHRQDLDALEEAAGYRALVDLGLSQRAIAEQVGRTQPHISKRLRLLDLPDKVQTAIRSGAWPLEDAVALAKLRDHPKALMALFERASAPGWWDSVARVATETLDHIAAVEAQAVKTAELEKRQLQVVTTNRPLDGRSGWLQLDDGAKPLGEQWSNGLVLDEDLHADGPCARWVVLLGGDAVQICTDPASHAGSAGQTARDKAEAKSRRLHDAHEAHAKALHKARKDRRAAAAAACRHTDPVDAEPWHLLRRLVTAMVDGTTKATRDRAAKLLDLTLDPDRPYEASATALVDHAALTPAGLASVATALYAAVREESASAGWHKWGQPEIDYLAWLGDEVGYTPSKAEQVELDKAAKASR